MESNPGFKNREKIIGNRQAFRPPVIRQPNKIDVMINTAYLFAKRVGIQLGKTLLATAFAALADFIRKKSDAETSSMLNKHGGFQDPNAKTENQRNLYGNQYPSENRSNYGGYYGSGYDQQRKSNGHESFPGFGQ